MAVAILLIVANSMVGQATAASNEREVHIDQRELAERASKLAIDVAKSFDIYVGNQSKTKLVLHEKSILRWSNPVSGRVFGEVFLWINRDRPLVLASVYRYYSPKQYVAVEFHSLAASKLLAKHDSKDVWYPTTVGVEFHALSDAPEPSKSASARLRQMRLLARDFKVQFTTLKDESEWLRLMPQPAYRYKSEDDNIFDGSIFIFAQGTNPEAILLLEARRTDAGNQWQFALARQTGHQMNGFYKQQNVWNIPTVRGELKLIRTSPYSVFYRYLDDETTE